MIGWAPVTVRETWAYVDATDVESRKKWYPRGQPREGYNDPEMIVKTLDRQLLRPNWPAVHLDIFDIRGYCAWRTAQRGDGRTIFLSSEAQWDAAAWNGLTESEYLQYQNLDDPKPAPVGCLCPMGDKRPVDLISGIAEWCNDTYSLDGPSDAACSGTNSNEGHAQVIKGKWKAEVSNRAPLSERHWDYMIDSAADKGFRVVLSPPLE
jgi:formylglycine-generating enzyme required for sulfatase activity